MSMDEQREPWLPSGRVPDAALISFGYLCAVSVATLLGLVAFSLAGFLLRGGALHGSKGFADDLMQLLMFVGVPVWFVVFGTALPPFALCCVAARWLRIRSVFYYAAWGAVTGLMLTPVAQWLFPRDPDEMDRARSFWEEIAALTPAFMFFGLCGALVYWFIAGRRLGLARAEAPGAPG